MHVCCRCPLPTYSVLTVPSLGPHGTWLQRMSHRLGALKQSTRSFLVSRALKIAQKKHGQLPESPLKQAVSFVSLHVIIIRLVSLL